MTMDHPDYHRSDNQWQNDDDDAAVRIIHSSMQLRKLISIVNIELEDTLPIETTPDAKPDNVIASDSPSIAAIPHTPHLSNTSGVIPTRLSYLESTQPTAVIPLIPHTPRFSTPPDALPPHLFYLESTQPTLDLVLNKSEKNGMHPLLPQRYNQYATSSLTRGHALIFIALLSIVVFQSLTSGQSQFTGSQGWAYVLGGPQNASNAAILKKYGKQTIQSGVKTTPTSTITPEAYVDQILSHMTLDEKLGQMMIVQFVGPQYSLDLSTMVKQYNVGAVLIFAANQNIESKSQLKGLISQMQNDSLLPMAIAIDQEGGTVDRLASLDGPRPSETTIGATGNPNVARQEGVRDAQDLSSYGINLNLAPVVDVTNVYNAQLDQRTYGTTPELVTKMASAYLNGLQQSGKVIGTLKHFPGLGDVSADPHSQVPQLTRSLSDLESIDWAPYRSLIQQGNTVHAIMVTHEIVQAVDATKPSSLSPKVVTGILRDQLGFNGVIITDSLTMESVTAYYDEAQAAILAVEAGCDLLMGASTPSDVATMLEGLKQAISSGQISQQRIDDSVRRILLMKYTMGLLAIPTH